MIINNPSPCDCLLCGVLKDMDDLLGSFRGYTRGGYTYRGLVQRGAFCLGRRWNVRSAITEIVGA